MRRYLKRSTVNFIFYIYILFLINFVVLKFFGSFDSIIDRIDGVLEQRRVFGAWNYSFNFFSTISTTIESFKQDPSLGLAMKLLIANILCFLPLGYLLALKLKQNSILRVMFFSLVIIISIEFIQFATCLGIADVDDVILNMLGSSIGYLMFVITENLSAVRQKVHGSNSS